MKEPFPQGEDKNEKKLRENSFEIEPVPEEVGKRKEERPGKSIKAIGIPGEEIHEIADEESQETS
jgi:hypothetical protein